MCAEDCGHSLASPLLRMRESWTKANHKRRSPLRRFSALYPPQNTKYCFSARLLFCASTPLSGNTASSDPCSPQRHLTVRMSKEAGQILNEKLHLRFPVWLMPQKISL